MNRPKLQPLPLYPLVPVVVHPGLFAPGPRHVADPIVNNGWGQERRRASPANFMNRQLTKNAVKGLLKLKYSTKRQRTARKAKKYTRRK